MLSKQFTGKCEALDTVISILTPQRLEIHRCSINQFGLLAQPKKIKNTTKTWKRTLGYDEYKVDSLFKVFFFFKFCIERPKCYVS